jgi:hypothetical protein
LLSIAEHQDAIPIAVAPVAVAFAPAPFAIIVAIRVDIAVSAKSVAEIAVLCHAPVSFDE